VLCGIIVADYPLLLTRDYQGVFVSTLEKYIILPHKWLFFASFLKAKKVCIRLFAMGLSA
jgi:hypothetical protein